jgi:hypothetical protein
MLAIIWSILLTLFRFLFADQMWAAMSDATMAKWPVRRIPFVVHQPIRHAVVAGDNVLVLSGKGNDRRLVLSTPMDGDKTLAALILPSPSGPEEFVARGGGWWYATYRWHFDRPATLFIADDGSGTVQTNVVDDPVAIRNVDSWIVVRGDRPRGLIIHIGDQGVEATAIDPQGQFTTWRLPLLEKTSGREWAEMLPDGSIALLVNTGRGTCSLFLLDRDGHVGTVDFGQELVSVVTAVDADGNIALMTSGGNCVLGAVINPRDPKPIIWRRLSSDADVVTIPSPVGYLSSDEMRVAAVSGGFIAAWVTHSGATEPRLYARELRPTSVGAWPVEVGQPYGSRASFSRDAFSDLHADGDGLRFYWDDGHNLVTRHLPASVSGFQLVRWLGEWCSTE